MKNVKRVFFVLLIFIIPIFLVSCEKQDDSIVFDDEYPLALSPSVNWAVIKEPYAAYKKDIGWSSPVVGHCRRGEILQILGQTTDESGEKWCHFEDGWLPDSCLNIYTNRLKAERVSEILLKQDTK